MQVTVDWLENVHFVATNDSGHKVAMDGPPDQGGEDRGSHPMKLMLMGLGGCTTFDVVDILRKGRQQVAGLRFLRLDHVRQGRRDRLAFFRVAGSKLSERYSTRRYTR